MNLAAGSFVMNLARRHKVDIDDLIQIWLDRRHKVSEVNVDELVFMHPVVERGLVTREKSKS